MAALLPSLGSPLARRLGAALAVTTLLLGAGCQRDKGNDKGKAKPPAGSVPLDKQPAGADGAVDLDSKDVLARTTLADSVEVKHVLIGWDKLAASNPGRTDPRADKRSNAEAAKLARDIAAQLKAAPERIDELVKQYSEDPGSAQSGEPYTINGETPFVPEFKNLALRLQLKEVGIVKTRFGYHVIERVAPPPPDPLESIAILSRPAGTETVTVQHVLIGWKDVPAGKQRPLDPRAQTRDKAAADVLAQEVLAKVNGGADMVALMKEYSEDPGSKDGKPYDVGPTTSFVQPFKDLALRLQVNEAGLVKTVFGWHVIKRVPPPPPDPLETADILARAQVTAKAKVKHILLGYAELNAGTDDRGKKRTRAEVEKLVAKTVADLKKGAKIDVLMKQLSEDPGSAAAGTAYDVDPNAGLVAPFKNLSLRLNVGEVGVVKTQFGFHIIQRTE